jgi:hypothetical protein
MTPSEKLKSLLNAKRFLKPGVTFKQLDQTARASAIMRPPEGSMRHETNSSYPLTLDPNVQPETYLLLPSFRLKPELELTVISRLLR